MMASNRMGSNLWVVCLLLGAVALWVGGCTSTEKTEDADQASAEASSAPEQAEESGVEIRLVEPEPAGQTEPPAPAPAVQQKPQVAEQKPQPMTEDIYADRPDPFSEERISRLENGLKPLASVPVPEDRAD